MAKKTPKKSSLKGRAALINASISQTLPPGFCLPNSPDPKKRCRKPRRKKR